jgi:alcohol dehydrogenase class IV
MEAGPPGAQWSGFKDFSQFRSPTRIVAGRGLLDGAGFEFTKEAAGRVMLVTDEVIAGTGLADRVADGLTGGGLEVAGRFADVPQDSDTQVVAECAAAAQEAGADSFLALGGGSVMDTAKAANILFTHGGEVGDYEGVWGLPRDGDGMGRPRPLAPLAAIPTTAGTGSEVSTAAVVKDQERGIKVIILDFPLAPELAILDPDATATLPAALAASTGMDALTHAIEGVTSSEWTPFTDAYALHALKLIRANLERAVSDTTDEEARGNMLVAANLAIAPTAFGASGITHSMSHPCGARHGVPHGVANAINLPVTIEFNAAAGEGVADRHREVADVLGTEVSGSGPEVGAGLASWVRELTARLGLPTRLSEVGVSEESIGQLAEDAMGEGSTLVNPREATKEEFVELFRQAL